MGMFGRSDRTSTKTIQTFYHLTYSKQAYLSLAVYQHVTYKIGEIYWIPLSGIAISNLVSVSVLWG